MEFTGIKIAISLMALACVGGAVRADLPTESVYSVVERNGKYVAVTTGKGEGGIPKGDQGVGPLALQTSNGEQEIQVNLMRYNLHLAPKAVLPFYMFVGRPIESKIDADTVTSALMNPDGGVVNFKLADDDLFCFMPKADVVSAAYVLGYDAGMKAYEVEMEGESDYDYSPYASLFFKADIPITEAAKKVKSVGITASEQEISSLATVDPSDLIVGRLVFSIAAMVSDSDSDKYKDLFMETEVDPNSIDGSIETVIARASFNITNQFSVEAGGVITSSSNSFDNYSYFKINYDFRKNGMR